MLHKSQSSRRTNIVSDFEKMLTLSIQYIHACKYM